MSNRVYVRIPWQARFPKFVIPGTPDECWLWTGCKGRGYGQIKTDEGMRTAHKVLWEYLVGPVPKGMQLDHLCRVRACVNPNHLQVVTAKENNARSNSITAINARKTHCPQGHPYDEENTCLSRGKRCCRACARDAWYRRSRAKRGR